MPNNSSHIGGDNYGTVGVGSTQIIGSITQSIYKLEAKPETKALADALSKLTKGIETSTELGPEKAKERLLDDVKTLSEQATQPKTGWKLPDIQYAFNNLTAAASAAGGLAVIWQVAGPAIRSFFGF